MPTRRGPSLGRKWVTACLVLLGFFMAGGAVLASTGATSTLELLTGVGLGPVLGSGGGGLPGQYSSLNEGTHRRVAVISASTASSDGRYRAQEQWLGVANKRAYGERHGYDVHVALNSLTDRPPAWAKIVMLQRHFHQYDWLLWMDGDAIVTNPERTVEQMLHEAGVEVATSHLFDRRAPPGPGAVAVHSSLYVGADASLCDLFPGTAAAQATPSQAVRTRRPPVRQDTLTVRLATDDGRLITRLALHSGEAPPANSATPVNGSAAAGRADHAELEASADGLHWSLVAPFWPNGTAAGSVPERAQPVQFVRVRWLDAQAQPVVLRGLDLERGNVTGPTGRLFTPRACSVATHAPQVSLLVAKDWNGLNSGVMLWRARGDQWSEQLLEQIWAHTSAIHHPWWEQKALMDIIAAHQHDAAWAAHIKYVPLRTFNSYFPLVASWAPPSLREQYRWQPGDFAVHCPGLHNPREFHEYFERHANISHNLPPPPPNYQAQLTDEFANLVHPLPSVHQQQLDIAAGAAQQPTASQEEPDVGPASAAAAVPVVVTSSPALPVAAPGGDVVSVGPLPSTTVLDGRVPSIALVTRLLAGDDGLADELRRPALLNKLAFAQRHGYALYFDQRILGGQQALNRSSTLFAGGRNGPRWLKLAMLRRLLPDHDWLVWIEPAALFRGPLAHSRVPPLQQIIHDVMISESPDVSLIVAKGPSADSLDSRLQWFRRTPWTAAFLDRLWNEPALLDNYPDDGHAIMAWLLDAQTTGASRQHVHVLAREVYNRLTRGPEEPNDSQSMYSARADRGSLLHFFVESTSAADCPPGVCTEHYRLAFQESQFDYYSSTFE